MDKTLVANTPALPTVIQGFTVQVVQWEWMEPRTTDKTLCIVVGPCSSNLSILKGPRLKQDSYKKIQIQYCLCEEHSCNILQEIPW